MLLTLWWSITRLNWSQELFSFKVVIWHSRLYMAKDLAYLCQHCLHCWRRWIRWIISTLSVLTKCCAWVYILWSQCVYACRLKECLWNGSQWWLEMTVMIWVHKETQTGQWFSQTPQPSHTDATHSLVSSISIIIIIIIVFNIIQMGQAAMSIPLSSGGGLV